MDIVYAQSQKLHTLVELVMIKLFLILNSTYTKIKNPILVITNFDLKLTMVTAGHVNFCN